MLLFKNLDFSKHQFLIGSGVRYETSTTANTEYELDNTTNGVEIYRVKRMYNRVRREIVWQGILFQYNYHISKSLLVGLNATFIDHQENFPSVEVRKGYSRPIKPSRNYMALANIGLQFGVKF